jgi:hypothetical protein
MSLFFARYLSPGNPWSGFEVAGLVKQTLVCFPASLCSGVTFIAEEKVTNSSEDYIMVGYAVICMFWRNFIVDDDCHLW